MVWTYTITDVLNMWQQQGVFAYALPFLLIFAVIFGILSKTKLLGENKGVQATIALAMGLLALQFDIVTNFYATIFPYAGVGVAILLVALIFMGVVSDKIPWANKAFFWIGAIIAGAVVLLSFQRTAWFGGNFWLAESWPAIIAGIILVGLIAFIVYGGDKSG
ncbi:Uncharacterised protein [uncultured archaeon]|nr:Uncharacterised protein [uncultured archaeon]